MFEFKLPDLGEGVAEGEILKWYVEVGEEVKEDEPLVDIETDKAAVTIPSPKGGKLLSCAGEVGDTIEVGTVLVTIDAEGGAAAAAPAPKKEAPKQEAPKPTPAPAPSAPAATNSAAPKPTPTPASAQAPARATAPVLDRKGPVPAAPATRRLARELKLNINQIPGSGPAGRVTAEDVRLFAEGGVATAPIDTEVAAGSFESSGIPYYEVEAMPNFEQFGPVEREAFRSLRRKTAKKMVASMVTVPHVGHMDDADVTELEAARARMKENGRSITMLAFVIKAVTVALKRHKMFNASLDPHRNELVYKYYYNIGFAADTPRGLMVPVIKSTDQLSVVEIAAKIKELAIAAREGTIDVANLQGGTYTVTNVGSIGGTYVFPTINYPECAILGMGRTVVRPGYDEEGMLSARSIIPMCMTYDHRIADGANGARFMNDVCGFLADPMTLLAEM
jgi:pyruvate dehydrogenase E2 component (dihydrolipoamide acetyltransferase)